MSQCKKELILDLNDYIEGGTVFKRKAVRGIVKHKDKYLVIHGKYGDYKFPGLFGKQWLCAYCVK